VNDRLPPYSAECEMGLLGCILLTPVESIGICVETLNGGKDAFYDIRHEILFNAIMAMHDAGLPVDVLTLGERLRTSGQLEQVGGLSFLASLPDATPSAANLPAYIEVINEKKVLRDIIRVGTGAVSSCWDAGAEPSAILDDFERAVLAIRPLVKRPKRTFLSLVQATLERIESVWKRRGGIEGLSTSFPDLDKMTGGLHPGEMTVIAGYPGTGKTSLAMNISEHAVCGLGATVGVFSLEMSAIGLVTRFICSHARVNLRNVSDGFLGQRDFDRLAASAAKVSGAALWIEDDSDLSIHQLRAKARRIHQEHGVALIVVDYIQLLTATGGARRVENRQQEVADVSRGIKGIARELNVPVLALSQLNDDGKLRESRAIGQDADNVWVLKINDNDKDEAGSVELEIQKARNGPRGKVPLVFLRAFTRFESAAKLNDSDFPSPQMKMPYADM
jgi:replicative DNA helicase